MVLYGNAGGEHPDPIAPTLLTKHGSLTLMRPALYDYVEDQPAFQKRLAGVIELYQKGDINLKNLTVAPLEEAAAVHEAMLGRQVVGKAILKI